MKFLTCLLILFLNYQKLNQSEI